MSEAVDRVASGPSRRKVAGAALWATPSLVVAQAAPSMAASVPQLKTITSCATTSNSSTRTPDSSVSALWTEPGTQPLPDSPPFSNAPKERLSLNGFGYYNVATANVAQFNPALGSLQSVRITGANGAGLPTYETAFVEYRIYPDGAVATSDNFIWVSNYSWLYVVKDYSGATIVQNAGTHVSSTQENVDPAPPGTQSGGYDSGTKYEIQGGPGSLIGLPSATLTGGEAASFIGTGQTPLFTTTSRSAVTSWADPQQGAVLVDPEQTNACVIYTYLPA